MWVNYKKTRQQLRPAKVTHRMHDALVDLDLESGQERNREKIPSKREIRKDGKLIGKVIHNEFVWKGTGKALLSTDERTFLKAFAEDD